MAQTPNYTDQGGALQHIGGELDVESGAVLDVKSGAALKIAGTTVTASAAELNQMHSQAMSAADVAKLHAITATAAEINVAGGVVAGTATASSLAVLGASQNLDVLKLPVGGLWIGPATTEVDTTVAAAELNALHSQAASAADFAKLHAISATAAEINAILAAEALATDGLWRLGVARFTFDATANAGLRTQAAHGTGVTLPQYAIVCGGFYEVNTAFTSAGSTATVAISVEGANDIKTATAVSDATFGTIGRKAIVPKALNPETNSVKTMVAREITVTIGVQDLAGGKLTGFLYYVVSVASA